MVVMVLERVPRGLRGELTRWLLEVHPGVVVGRASAMVRELLWEKAVTKARKGRCAMAYSTNSEQGFEVRLFGYEDRLVRDFDGLQLVTVRSAEALRRSAKLKRGD